MNKTYPASAIGGVPYSEQQAKMAVGGDYAAPPREPTIRESLLAKREHTAMTLKEIDEVLEGLPSWFLDKPQSSYYRIF